MSDRGLKVTDKRMFTADGELREEFVRRQESLNQERAGSDESVMPSPGAGVEPEPAPQIESPPAVEQVPEDDAASSPHFTDLVRLLAENASIYLAESRDGDPQTAQQHLELARLHIDMLGVLQDKTRGNLTPEEHAMLESVVHQLRSSVVGFGS